MRLGVLRLCLGRGRSILRLRVGVRARSSLRGRIARLRVLGLDVRHGHGIADVNGVLGVDVNLMQLDDPRGIVRDDILVFVGRVDRLSRFNLVRRVGLIGNRGHALGGCHLGSLVNAIHAIYVVNVIHAVVVIGLTPERHLDDLRVGAVVRILGVIDGNLVRSRCFGFGFGVGPFRDLPLHSDGGDPHGGATLDVPTVFLDLTRGLIDRRHHRRSLEVREIRQTGRTRRRRDGSRSLRLEPTPHRQPRNGSRTTVRSRGGNRSRRRRHSSGRSKRRPGRKGRHGSR
ncbi:hypothetical protein [Streptomyces umbrinus]|uniref:hypothetical protein n=1 Tax=Streptomyces umbrinus TaxID=67370 RepID=UPI003F4CB790